MFNHIALLLSLSPFISSFYLSIFLAIIFMFTHSIFGSLCFVVSFMYSLCKKGKTKTQFCSKSTHSTEIWCQ